MRTVIALGALALAVFGLAIISAFFPTLLAVTGLTGVGLLLIGLLTVALIIGAVAAPQTRGKTLREIEIERYGTPISEVVPADAGAATGRTVA